MVYIETRTTHTEVLADLLQELDYKINGVISSATNHRAHPTFNTKTAIRAELQQLMGAAEMVRNVHGGTLPDAVEAKIGHARAAVDALNARR